MQSITVSNCLEPLSRTYSIDYCGRKITNNKMPKEYIITEKATILIWEDGTKTVVKICDGDTFNKRLGFLIAYFQYHSGLSKHKANEYLANLEVRKEKSKKEKKKNTNKEEKPIKHTKEKTKPFDIGSIVTVRQDLKIDESYGGECFVYEMEKFKGKKVTISANLEDGDFHIKEDDRRWFWTKEMFEEGRK